MKTILACSDLSERSDRAVQRALRLAREFGAECQVLTVVDDSLPPDLAEKTRGASEARLTRQAEAFGDGGEVVACIGDPAGTIPEQAARIGADLLVVGMHRLRPFLDAVSQTTMERLVRMSKTPVLLVRQPADHAYETVLALVSFSPACARAVRAAAAIAPEAPIDAIHAVHVPFTGLTGEGRDSAMARAVTAEAEATASAWRQHFGFGNGDFSLTFATDSLTRLLERNLAQKDYDLIAIGAHTRTGPFAHGLGSFAAELIRDPPTDLLIARS